MSQQRKTDEAEPISKKPKLDLTQIADDMRVTRRHAAMLKDFDASIPSPFDKLPDEVLEHIFTFLDRNSLLNSLLVDRRCCGIIENSSKVMAHFTLTLNFWEKEKFKQKLKDSKLQRRYNSIEFIDYQTQKQISKFMSNTLKMLSPHVKSVEYRGFGRNFSELMDIFANKENLQLAQFTLRNFNPQPLLKVKIDRVCSFTPNFFVSLVSMCPNVKQLDLSYCCHPSGFTSAEDYEIQSLELKNLESLTLTVGVYNTMTAILYDFIRFGKFASLQNLTLKNFDALVDINWKSVIENNPKLETIDIDITRREHVFDFGELVSSARGGMKLKIRGSFRLTQDRLMHFKENSTRGFKLKVLQTCLEMSAEAFEEIVGEQKQMITFM